MTTAMKSNLKRKVMATTTTTTTKIHLSALLSVLSKEAKRIREKNI